MENRQKTSAKLTAPLGRLSLLQNAVFQTLPAGVRFGAHSHRHAELIFLTEGSCTLTIWKETLTLQPGEYAVILSSAVHTFTAGAQSPCSFWQLHFSPDLFCGEKCAGLWNTAPDNLAGLIRDLGAECAARNLYGPLYRNLLLGRLAFLLKREAALAARIVRFSPNPHVYRALGYLAAHYTEKLTLDEVAAACGISRRYLSRLFYADTLTTVTDYANLLRVNQAVDLLRDTALSVGRISETLGFSSVPYFSRLFKELTGFSPRAIRESFLPSEAP